ncbi:MAG: NAD(P)H-hydrate dehydratase [Phycisphaerae bacterium]
MKVPAFPERADDAHKGDVGRIVVIGGRFDAVGMVGAPALVANAAFRTGAGLVQILTTRDAQIPVSVLAPCATTRAVDAGEEGRLAALANEFAADVVAIGPGLSPRIKGGHVVRFLREFEGGVVVDADALNALAAMGTWRTARPQQVVVTPHPGEMKRLMAGLRHGVEGDQGGSTKEARQAAAEALAQETGAIVVLKGAGTVVTDGLRTYVNKTGHAGMATAGSGDVLTGVIAALIGQKMSPFEAGVLGAYLHGRAGDIAGEGVGLVSVTATDLIEALGNAIEEHRN